MDELFGEDDCVAVHWHVTGTFAGPTDFEGIPPTGNPIRLTGLDLVRVRDGLIARNDAYLDGLGFARQVGLLPPQGSATEDTMRRALGAKTRTLRTLAGTGAEPVADRVWRVRGGVPRSMNVYLIEDDGGGVTVFDAAFAR